MLARLLGIPLWVKILLIAVPSIIAGATPAWIAAKAIGYRNGVSDGKAFGRAEVRLEWAAAAKAERERQAAAIEQNRMFQEVEIEAVRITERWLSEQERKADEEARLDPDRDRPALGRGSVRRINQIRVGRKAEHRADQ